MFSNKTEWRRTQAIGTIAGLSGSTDLTLYNICDVLDDDEKRTGIFRLARKSLETNHPFVPYCNHNYHTADKAGKCAFFEFNGIQFPLSAIQEMKPL